MGDIFEEGHGIQQSTGHRTSSLRRLIWSGRDRSLTCPCEACLTTTNNKNIFVEGWGEGNFRQNISYFYLEYRLLW